jgi:NAD(P)H-hydrate repair Nnr-like enzyme with NAD(P)H-hydrate epimerase domain
MPKNDESHPPTVPLDIPTGIGRSPGLELEQLIHTRWLLTASVLRQELRAGAAVTEEATR